MLFVGARHLRTTGLICIIPFLKCKCLLRASNSEVAQKIGDSEKNWKVLFYGWTQRLKFGQTYKINV